MSVIAQAWDPGTAPFLISGNRPARTAEDFPEPDGPTTVNMRPWLSADNISWTRARRPWKSVASVS
jgi:hypothetical protein